MNKPLILFLSLLISLCCFSQIETDFGFKKGDQFISLTPINLIDPVTSNLEISYERLFTDNFGLKLSAGKIFLSDFLFETNKTAKNGIRLRLEGKKYIKTSVSRRFYYGVQLGYTYVEEKSNSPFGGCLFCQSLEPTDSIVGPDGTLKYVLDDGGNNDTITIFRNTILLNFKLGFSEQISPRFFVGGYVGLGVKLRLVDHFGRANNEDELSETRHPSSRRDEQGNTVVPSIPMNIEIIYRF